MTPIPPSQIPKDLTEAYERAVDSMAIQLERDALLSYTNLCEEHKLDCATGHRPFAKCASCLLTTATRMRFKAENEKDDAEQRIAKLTEERDSAQQANELDRRSLWAVVRAIDEEITGRMWLLEGRGSYEWDDDKYKQEFGWAVHALQEKLEPLRKIAHDLTNSPDNEKGVDAVRKSEQKIAKLIAEVERLKQWKREQLFVESEWNPQEVGRELGIRWGKSIRAEILPAVLKLKSENTRLKAPVSDEELTPHCLGTKYFLTEVFDKVIASRATRTPPQEGQ